MNRENFENEIEAAENELENEDALADAEPTQENSLVPAYTKEDFLTGVAPYEWIYQHKNNKLEYAQYTELMKAKAKEVGISNFMTLFKAYLETMGTISTVSHDNVTEFSGQPFQLNCGAWEASDYGVYGRNMFGGEVEACNHPIMPVRRLVNVDTDTEKIVLAFCKRGKRWRTIIADRKTISGTNSIISLADYGIAVNSENARNLIKYLAEVENLNLDIIPELKSVSRLGFIGEHGFSPYSEGLVFDGDSLYGEFYKSVSEAKGNCEKSIGLLNSLRESNVITRLYIAASFASVLVGMFDGLPFFVHLWGGTGNGKTVTLQAAASIWANPVMGKYVHTFDSTKVGHEASAAFVNNMPLGVDELQIEENRKNFDEFIYKLAEGVGKKRGNVNAGLRKVATWRNCILTTGEKPITSNNSGGGAINRVIEIDCKRETLINNPSDVLSVIKENYGHAGRIFVEHLLTDEGKQLAAQLQKVCYNNLKVGDDTTDKQMLSASFILAADKLANEWIFKSKTLLQAKDIKPYLATKKAVSVNIRALEFIYDKLNVNIKKLTPDSMYTGEIWGAVDNDYYYIIKSQFNKMLEDNGYNSAAFLSWAKENGVIEADREKNTKKYNVRFVGRVRCVWLRKNMGEILKE